MYRKCDNSEPTVVSHSQRKFNPGIFKLSCVHGVTYGFHFLKHAESPNELFTLLLTRFPRDKLPRLLCYDNGCKFFEYALNREPWMLKAMKVLVDNFHYGASRGKSVPIHKCPSSFCTKRHKAAQHFNSQYEEHNNAFVSLHKCSARTMQLRRAYTLLSIMLRCWNQQKSIAMQADMEGWLLQYDAAARMLPPA
jgi:hypothetical protein